MAGPVIQIEGLGKRYRIAPRERYRTLRDALANSLKAPWQLFARSSGNHRGDRTGHIWALKDISFTVERGEVVGLIGRNGAGKTTLLKILSRITKPTTGWAEVRGRVGSLLEVGTGFHPELTGQENVYLSGAVLGMKKKEIAAKFDPIVDFAGVTDFIDTPLKHYSTGMQTRLGFAVAAHLEPEILLIDEVLAVGDLEFQKKCLGKMSEVARGGRTVLFVSHQMNQIRRLCDRVLWIDRGKIRANGPTGEVVAAYEATQADPRDEGGGQCFLRWELPGQGNTIRELDREVHLMLELQLERPIAGGHLGVNIVNEESLLLVGWGFDGIEIPAGRQRVLVRIPSLPLRPGIYTLVCTLFNHGNNLTNGEVIERWSAAPPLVVDTKPVAHSQDRWAGLLNIPAQLEIPATETARASIAEHAR